jgi:hypothetical protein
MTHPYKARPVAETHVWLTPPEIIKALGPFTLDPCASADRPWDTAYEHYSLPEQDGLALPWFNRVWLNPPYGPHTSAWLEKMAEHHCGTALVFARTETRMFRRFVWPSATALLFLSYRPHFHHADGTRAKGNCGGPMVLIAYGKDDAAHLARSNLPGAFIVLR